MARVSKQDRAMLSAWRRFQEDGQTVKAVRISPVGDVFLLTEAPSNDLPSPDDDWVSLAGETAVSRA